MLLEEAVEGGNIGLGGPLLAGNGGATVDKPDLRVTIPVEAAVVLVPLPGAVLEAVVVVRDAEAEAFETATGADCLGIGFTPDIAKLNLDPYNSSD